MRSTSAYADFDLKADRQQAATLVFESTIFGRQKKTPARPKPCGRQMKISVS